MPTQHTLNMSNLTIYKRLFEVRILHGFHLDHWYWNGNTPLAFHRYASDADREFILENKYNILEDLIIEPTAKTKKLLKGTRMPWRILPSGILVGLEVERTTDGAGITRFFPKISLPEDATWTFVLRARNPQFFNITNHALRPTLPGRYYFSNLFATEHGKVFPSLSVQLPGFSANRTWEMGELIRVGSQIREAAKTTSMLTDFTVISSLANWSHYVHSGNRTALPKQFTYRFDSRFNNLNPVTSAEFTLSDMNGDEKLKIEKEYTVTPAPDEINLDFRYYPLPPNPTVDDLTHRIPLEAGWYRLTIQINGALYEQRDIMLRNDLSEDDSVLGLIEIGNGPTSDAFRLFDPADGSLRLTAVSDNGATRWRPPVFEVRLLSRATYWQYQIEKTAGLPPHDIDFTEVQYQSIPKRLVTLKPRRLSLARAPVRVDTPSTDIYLPNPERLDLKYAQHQYYSELFLSTIKLD